MCMNATILAVRAVAATFVVGIIKPLLFIVGGVYVVIFGLSWWLASAVHVLWWLLAILTAPLCVVLLIALSASFLLARRLRPQMNQSQHQLASSITDQINNIAEQVGTPRVIILARVVRDIVTQTDIRRSYIGELAQEPGELRRNFLKLKDSFGPK